MGSPPAPPGGGLGGAPHPGGPIGYYAPPAGGGRRPAVVLWFRVYAIVSGLALFAFFMAWQFLTPAGGQTSTVEVLGILALCAPFLALYGVGAAVPFKPWGWTYALILIGFGMLGCLAPFSIVLIIFWNRPEVKAAFQRV